MMDARFEDGDEQALALRAETAEDLPVISALVQDAVFNMTDVSRDVKARKIAFLVNRFRWEDKALSEAAKRPYERVRALLVVSDVTSVVSQGIDRTDPDLVLSVLDLVWTEGEDGTGVLTLTLAGDGAIGISVECLSVDLRDVSRPYRAVSGSAPHHVL